jgi:hypothetical protein
VPGDFEAFRSLYRLAGVQTAFQFEDFPAGETLKVMVVMLPGALVARRFAREQDLGDPSLLQQGLYIPVDRGDSQARVKTFGLFEDFIRG